MSNDSLSPIFIFSLPRSGSTLLQRILMGHSKISSIAEPHFLLPFVYSLKDEGILSEYSHYAAHQGLEDLIQELPNKDQDYYKFLKEFSLNIYGALSNDKAIYFLDKTPRYLWIVQEIEKIFPKAKFIFLFRDPLQIYASLLTTFCNSKFKKLYRFQNFIEKGMVKLAEGYSAIESKSLRIEYEDLIEDTEGEIEKIFAYLSLENEEVIKNFKTQILTGRSQDPTGSKMYKSINTSPLTKWKDVFNTPFRKRLLKNYLRKIPDSILKVHGFEKKKLILSIDQLDSNGRFNIVTDALDCIEMRLIMKFHLNLFFDKKSKWARDVHLN